jgi:hypothetical protein
MDGFSIGLPKLASLSAYGFILEFGWPASINMRVGMTQIDIYGVKNSCMYIVVLSTK